MSQRKTNKWTENLEDAYVDSSKGRPGEIAIINHLKEHGARNVIDWEANQEVQQSGIDISYDDAWGQTITVQVKENYIIERPVVTGAPSARFFYIECDEGPKHKHIKYVEADFMVHVCLPERRFAIYETWRMVEAEATVELQKHESRGVLIACIPSKKFDWISLVDLTP